MQIGFLFLIILTQAKIGLSYIKKTPANRRQTFKDVFRSWKFYRKPQEGQTQASGKTAAEFGHDLSCGSPTRRAVSTQKEASYILTVKWARPKEQQRFFMIKGTLQFPTVSKKEK